MLYISGARSVAEKQVRIASTKMYGIGPKKAIQVRYRDFHSHVANAKLMGAGAIQLCFVHLSLALAGLSGTTLFRVPLPWGSKTRISSYWLVRIGCFILLGVILRKALVFMNAGGDLMDIVRPFLGAESGMNPGSGGGQPSDSFIPPFVQEGESHDKDAGSPAWETFGSIQELPTLEGGQRQPAQGDVVDLELDSGWWKTKDQTAWERDIAKGKISDYREALLVEFENTRKNKGAVLRKRWTLAMNSLLKGKSPDVWYQKLLELRNQKKESPFYKAVHNWFMEQRKSMDGGAAGGRG